MKEGEPRKRSSVAMEKQFLLSVIPGGSLSAVDYFRIGALIVALTPAVVKRTKYHDSIIHGSLVKRLRRRPLTAETRVRFPYWLLTESNQNMFLVAFLFMITNGDFGRFYYDH